ncbi:hypothetical protein [Embleya hyalina]|uniref:Uncharacterized protein n=1 Tax=Embleya hyalina TaxID=516124 RepID=A0A401Z570_9ACTN|nr:hypothetical protein [Embleya hyalina]GCE01985.1 hypothetical protein EHYA_09760 [Embleya hyalina]
MNPRRWVACAILAFVAGVAFAAAPGATTVEHGSTHAVAATAIEYGL